nr:reverse transcriptase domain-containing protein [Tanacetum cinerariifolium]
MDEMMSVTTAFLRGEMAASNRERKKSFPSWKQETRQKQNFKRGNFLNEQRLERKQDRFTLPTKTPREILALDKGKFKPPPPMTTLVEKRNASKFCEFHGEVGHTTNECMHLKRKIKEMLKAGKLSYLIKELKQNNKKDQAKTAKKGENFRKDIPLTILMVQPWQRIARTTKVDVNKNNEALGISLDLLEEKREQAAIQEARSKARMEVYYNARVQSTSFRPGDLVYQNNEASHIEGRGKLGPKWKGPYEVTEALGKGTYKLKDRNGLTLP